MSEPKQTCTTCGRVVVVRLYGREFPPATAKRRLAKRCIANGCLSTPRYTAGLRFTATEPMVEDESP